MPDNIAEYVGLLVQELLRDHPWWRISISQNERYVKLILSSDDYPTAHKDSVEATLSRLVFAMISDGAARDVIKVKAQAMVEALEAFRKEWSDGLRVKASRHAEM